MPKRTLSAIVLALCVAAASAAVDINKADQAELEKVKGIGPSLSQRILDERGKRAFKDWADVIERLKGVGAGSAARLSAGGLTVGGNAYAGAASRSRPAAAASGTGGRSAASAVTAASGAGDRR